MGKLLLPKALKSCPKSNKSPNVVTLIAASVNATVKSQVQSLETKTIT